MFSFETVFVDDKGNIDRHEQHQVQCISIELGNDVNLELVYIPGGSFVMGAPEEEEGSGGWERPQHLVNLKPFYMGKYPITQKQFEAVLHKNPAKFEGENHPVEWVSWNDATDFCRELSKKTGLAFELPSEAKWEYACRAGTTNPFYFGATISAELANYNTETIYGGWISGKYRSETIRELPNYDPEFKRYERILGEYCQGTSEVGMFPPNAFGLYDMHGNVWEWCNDIRYGDYQGAPTDGTVWNRIALCSGDKDDEIFMIRGGGWQSKPDRCRSAASDEYRYCERRSDIGFRVVLIPSTKTHADVVDPQAIAAPIQHSRVLELIDKAAKEHWKILDLSSQNLTKLPAEIGKLKHLTGLNLSNNQISEIPIAIGELVNLTSLNLSNNQVTNISAAIGSFKSLTNLSLSNNQITNISPSIGDLKKLVVLNLHVNKIAEIPAALCGLVNLTHLNLSDNQITEIPRTIRKLKNLTSISLSLNKITEVPQWFESMINLVKIDIGGDNRADLEPIPIRSEALRLIDIADEENWEILDLSNQNLTTVPAKICKLKHLISLNLSNNQISKISIEIGELTNLINLNLSNNNIYTIPESIFKLKSLTSLNLSRNRIARLPAAIGNLENLENLDLQNLGAPFLPVEIGNLKKLKNLNLRDGLLLRIPVEIGNLRRLTSLNLYGNQLAEIPATIGELKNLTSLDFGNNERIRAIFTAIGELENLTSTERHK
jgi:formylglycine-generating enzyme required for sulfatase activity/Leucine-rich repeat (LRR) protein